MNDQLTVKAHATFKKSPIFSNFCEVLAIFPSELSEFCLFNVEWINKSFLEKKKKNLTSFGSSSHW